MSNRSHLPEHSQADLFGGGEVEAVPLNRLFFALLPDAGQRARLAQAVAVLKANHPGLRARWVSPARYHATLHFLGDHALLRQDMVGVAVTAAGKLRLSPFEWVLHEAVSFQGRQPPCVLLSSSVPGPLQLLWEDLRRGLVLAGQGHHIARNFAPHVTFAYSQGSRLDITPIEPVAWQVERLALVHSVAGQPDYRVLAEWPLRGR